MMPAVVLALSNINFMMILWKEKIVLLKINYGWENIGLVKVVEWNINIGTNVMMVYLEIH